MSRKPRADAVLKTLTPERQEAIAEHARDHTIADTVTWLRDDGLETSGAAVSEFLSWFHLGRQLQRNDSTVGQLLSQLKATGRFDAQQLQEAGQLFFTALAIEQRDSKSWKRAQDIRMKERELAVTERRVAMQEAQAKAHAAVEEVSRGKNSKLDPETKAEILAAIDSKLLGL